MGRRDRDAGSGRQQHRGGGPDAYGNQEDRIGHDLRGYEALSAERLEERGGEGHRGEGTADLRRSGARSGTASRSWATAGCRPRPILVGGGLELGVLA